MNLPTSPAETRKFTTENRRNSEEQARSTPAESAETPKAGVPSALGCYLEAASRLAGLAADRGDLSEARRIIEDGLRAIEATEGRYASLRIVQCEGRGA